jgi:hypothetical protein
MVQRVIDKWDAKHDAARGPVATVPEAFRAAQRQPGFSEQGLFELELCAGGLGLVDAMVLPPDGRVASLGFPGCSEALAGEIRGDFLEETEIIAPLVLMQRTFFVHMRCRMLGLD